MLNGHLSAWLTATFAALLLLLTVSGGTRDATGTVVLLLGALVVLAVLLATEQALHRTRSEPRRPTQP